MIKCGHCGGYHKTVTAVRACCGVQVSQASVEDVEREMQRMEAEADRSEARREAAAKAAKWQREVDLSPATPEALNELRSLLASKIVPEHELRYARAVRQMLEAGNATGFAVRTAYARIEGWQDRHEVTDWGHWSAADRERAWDQRAKERPVEREGLYRLSREVWCGRELFAKGTLFQVVKNREGSRMYARQVVWQGKGKRPRLEYAAGMVYKLLESELVSRDEAQEITRQTGWCVFGHFLTDPKSIARGMGPVCYKRYPHLAKNAA